MNINFEAEFSAWLRKQSAEFLDTHTTEDILKKYISGAFLGSHYIKMIELINTIEHTKTKQNDN